MRAFHGNAYVLFSPEDFIYELISTATAKIITQTDTRSHLEKLAKMRSDK